MNILNLFDAGPLKTEDYGPRFMGAVLEIAESFGAKSIGFHLEVLNPKTFSCPYHWHEQEEEIAIVLEGEAVVRKNGAFRKVKAGDLIFYETGPQSAHHMYNHTERPFKFLAMSSKSQTEKCHYPDSQKTMDRETRTILQKGQRVDYWKDETDPSVHWPAHALKGEV